MGFGKGKKEYKLFGDDPKAIRALKSVFWPFTRKFESNGQITAIAKKATFGVLDFVKILKKNY